MLHPVILRDVGCKTEPPPSFPREETKTEDDTDVDENVEDPPFVEQNVLPPPVSPDEDKTFRDVITFLRTHHDLGPMKTVASKALDSSWAKSSRKGAPVPTGASFAMPSSALGVNLREEMNGILDTMGRKLSSAYIPNPPTRQGQWYEPEENSFAAPFGVPSGLGSLSSAPRAEMERVSVSIPPQLLPSLEASLGASCNALTWMDWWVGSLFEFEKSLPE